MDKGKVIIIGGNKRAVKTTLAMMLHNKYNYNYYNFDMLLDSIETTFPELEDHNDDKYITLLNEMVKRSLDDANNYGVSTVYEYIFTPELLNNFKYKDQVQIYFLANLDITEDNIREDMIKYSKSFDWPTNASSEDIERNVREIKMKNEILKTDCAKYSFELINTSREDKRNIVLNKLCEIIDKRN